MAVFLVLFLFLPYPASGQEAKIRDILITPQGGQILVYAQVTNCFTKPMESAIMAGLTTTFTFLLNLYQERSGWMDSKVTSAEIKNTIKYDSVKKTFYVYSSMERDPAMFQDLESAKRAMSEFNGAIVFPKSVVRKDLPHYITMMAKLEKVRLPLHMEYVFFFVSLWDFETAWYRQPVNF
jgi:hypothetical protein